MGRRIIELKNITKTYGSMAAMDNVSFYIRENEFITLLGPSGCGKTTTLRVIGGFETPEQGEVIFEEKVINNVPPYKRQFNTVFQKYALFPHLNVFENIAFGLRIKKLNNKDIKERVSKMLKMVALEGFENRWIDSLSGGQQQRIAIARALVNEPRVLLLDEPLGALDLKLRKEMQIELMKIQKSLGITFIYVTHDQEEALTMSDTIVVMNKGRIQQIGTPVDVYNEPINRFVADFIGESNIIEGQMLEENIVEFSGAVFECQCKGFSKNEKVDIVLRPEDVLVVKDGNGKLKGVVKSVIFKGVHYEMLVQVGELEFIVHSTDMQPIGKEIELTVDTEDIHIMKRVMEDEE